LKSSILENISEQALKSVCALRLYNAILDNRRLTSNLFITQVPMWNWAMSDVLLQRTLGV